MTDVKCGTCGEVVYENIRVISHHNFQRLPDGRWRWKSMLFGAVVHECDPAFSIHAEVERILAEARK